MANHKSAKKRIRRNSRAESVNMARRSRIRTYIKNTRSLIENNDAKSAEDSLKQTQKELYKGVSKNLIEKNAAARTMSRLSRQIKALKSAG